MGSKFKWVITKLGWGGHIRICVFSVGQLWPVPVKHGPMRYELFGITMFMGCSPCCSPCACVGPCGLVNNPALQGTSPTVLAKPENGGGDLLRALQLESEERPGRQAGGWQDSREQGRQRAGREGGREGGLQPIGSMRCCAAARRANSRSSGRVRSGTYGAGGSSANSPAVTGAARGIGPRRMGERRARTSQKRQGEWSGVAALCCLSATGHKTAFRISIFPGFCF